jgi:hypothetical protein
MEKPVKVIFGLQVNPQIQIINGEIKEINNLDLPIKYII